jgi:hypothetical protein
MSECDGPLHTRGLSQDLKAEGYTEADVQCSHCADPLESGEILVVVDPCPTCHGAESVKWQREGGTPLEFFMDDCPECESGYVVSGYVQATTYPIVEWQGDEYIDDVENTVEINPDAPDAPIFWDAEGNDTIIVLPGAVPGGVAIHLTPIPVQSEDPNATGMIWDRGDGTFWMVEPGPDPYSPPEGLPLPPIGRSVSPVWDGPDGFGTVTP